MASPQQYTLGRGRLFFAKFLPDSQVQGPYRYIGNTPSITMTAEPDTLDHYSSDYGINEKDESVMLQLDRSGTFDTDSIRVENLALLMMGETEEVVTAVAPAQTEIFTVTSQNDVFMLGVTANTPTGVPLATITTVTDGASEEYVAGADYVFDSQSGLLSFVEGGAIEAGDEITVTYAIPASTRTRVVSGSTMIEGALFYKADNPVGPNRDYVWPWVKLSPNGDFELKGDDWQTIPFSFEVLRKDPLAAVYINGTPSTTAAP